MSKNRENNLILEDVRLIFRNFSGRASDYNREGVRGFSVLLETKLAERMERDGWNVKWLPAREEGDERQAHLPVTARYDRGRPPRIFMITSNNRTPIFEDTVDMLDWADLETVDLTIRPYDWETPTGSGRKAYLQTMYVTLDEDDLDRKYGGYDVPTKGGKVND